MVYVSKYFNSGGGTVSAGIAVATGALVAGNNTVIHSLALANYNIQLRNATNIAMVNQVYPDPTDPSNQIIVNVGAPIAGGLTLFLVGW
uniref:Uncharacterized protein n=1 Tax=viral metagenome TaxID=1070528 RepID=A0A6M3K4Z2_9ZZZZ